MDQQFLRRKTLPEIDIDILEKVRQMILALVYCGHRGVIFRVSITKFTLAPVCSLLS